MTTRGERMAQTVPERPWWMRRTLTLHSFLLETTVTHTPFLRFLQFAARPKRATMETTRDRKNRLARERRAAQKKVLADA